MALVNAYIHASADKQREFERSLITHTHQELARRVSEKHNLRLSAVDNEFLDLLGKFYRTHRYGRFAVASAGSIESEKRLLHQFITRHLSIEIEDQAPFQITPNDSRIKRFIGRRVEKPAIRLYEIINEEARRLGIYTYELRLNSKADKIFLRRQFDFRDEDVLWRELLLFIVNSPTSTGMLGFIKSLTPLPFDPGLVGDYLQCFASEERKLDVLDELEHLYGEVPDVKRRLEEISVIGAQNIVFGDEQEDDDPDEYF